MNDSILSLWHIMAQEQTVGLVKRLFLVDAPIKIFGIYRAQNEAYKEVNGEKQRKALPVKELCVMAASGRTKRNVYMGLYSV